jgi:hypothetical protein
VEVNHHAPAASELALVEVLGHVIPSRFAAAGDVGARAQVGVLGGGVDSFRSLGGDEFPG